MRITVPDYIRNMEPEVLEEIVQLRKHPRFKLLIEHALEARESYFVNLARGIATHEKPVDQREIDEKRGFWEGVIWALREFPAMTELQWKRFIESDEEAPEEAEES